MISRKKYYDIQYLSEKDINDNDCTLDKLQRMTPYFHKDNPELYKLYLASRPDLGETVKKYYLELIYKLEQNEKKDIDDALKVFRDTSEYYK